MDATYDYSTQDRLTHCLDELPELRTILTQLSQEISRPLVSLRVGSENLLANSLRGGPSDRLSHLQMLVTLCDDLLKMTRDYLDEGLVRGAQPLHLEKWTLGALAEAVDCRFRLEASRRKLHWQCFLDSTDTEVNTDVRRFQHILGQIIANAFQFTPEGGRILVVARQDPSHWSFCVTDNGPGIPEAYLETVFDPFFRLPRDDREGRAGQGIGLAVCRELVDKLQGQIRIQSAENGGTQVVIEFPNSFPG